MTDKPAFTDEQVEALIKALEQVNEHMATKEDLRPRHTACRLHDHPGDGGAASALQACHLNREGCGKPAGSKGSQASKSAISYHRLRGLVP